MMVRQDTVLHYPAWIEEGLVWLRIIRESEGQGVGYFHRGSGQAEGDMR